jgi:cellular nucleic acid-binding protein
VKPKNEFNFIHSFYLPPTDRMEQIYVLQLENSKYYVGKTADVMKRFEQHKSGSGSAWTSKYKPVKMLECRALSGEHDENNVTKDYMKKYGINNVRGGSYTQVSLPADVESVLQREFRGNADVCYKCNLAGHFANQCPLEATQLCTRLEHGSVEQKARPLRELADSFIKQYGRPKPVKKVEEWGCDYCDRWFRSEFGCQVHERSCKPAPPPPTKKTTGTCYRCGRPGHYSPDCYATKHAKGYDLE